MRKTKYRPVARDYVEPAKGTEKASMRWSEWHCEICDCELQVGIGNEVVGYTRDDAGVPAAEFPHWCTCVNCR